MNSRTALFNLFSLVISLLFLQINSFSQSPPKPIEADFTWWYVSLLVLSVALAAAVIWWLKQKKEAKAADEVQNKKKDKNLDSHSFDADEEMEWLRKNQNIVDRKRRKAPINKPQINLPKTSEIFNNKVNNNVINVEETVEESANFENLDAIPLPVFGFSEIEESKLFNQLPLSNDEALLSAIEQTQDEDEEDEEVRELAVRILAAFQTRNSVEALSQVALYDLSSSLRSKAVTVLTEFDHETVFETILLACADPTREVRAAAARGLTRFSFDRADAWTRILQDNEGGRMRHAAKAAIEGGFVERSFDRLVHRDTKYAYEAFVLLALVIRAGEYDQIIEAMRNHRDLKVKRAILHILKVVKNQASVSVLYSMLEEKHLTAELREEIDQTIEEIVLVTA